MRGETLASLVQVMEKLLAPDGCPWDREQTLDTLKAYLLEEAHEVIEAIDSGDAQHHREELGDLLFQVVFQSALAQQQGKFDIDDVVASIREKLLRRHPHVFGGSKVADARAQVKVWERIKAEEKVAEGKPRRVLEGVPKGLPALQRAWRLGEKAGAVGFDWQSAREVLEKVREELDEVQSAVAARDSSATTGEIGDLLFAITQLARHVGVEPEDALRGSTAKFQRRFAYIEDRLQEAGKTPRESTLEEMEALWQQAKRLE